jgi:Flp pilus assembly protein TadD/ketosteroid isomerase-like protein
MTAKTAPNTLRRAVGNVCAGAGLLAALLAAPVFADELADVTKLLRAGKAADALARTNAYLAKHPSDPQMRFMKGVLLTEQNKSDEAIAIFTKLTEDYKDLPEPYNNLAVLYAASGQYDKARVALERAIRTNPSYMTAYENLGDVYGKLASQAYDKALALGTGTPLAASKLTLLRTFSSSTGSKLAAVAADAAAAASHAPAAPASAPAPAAAAARAAPVAPPAAVAAAAPGASAKLVSQIPEQPKTVPMQRIPSMAVTPQAAAPVPAAVAAKPAPVAAAAGNADRDEVLNRVNGWAKAWASQDVNGYLGYYSDEFTPPKGLSRKAWADERRARIEGKGRIRVEVTAPQVVITGDTAKVSFRQVYESDRLSANSRKTLVMVKHGGKWQIKQESSSS